MSMKVTEEEKDFVRDCDKMNNPNMAVAIAITRLARAVEDHTYRIGTKDAMTPFGALEALGMSIEKIAKAIDRLDFSGE